MLCGDGAGARNGRVLSPGGRKAGVSAWSPHSMRETERMLNDTFHGPAL